MDQLSRINAELEEDQQQLDDDIMKILRKPANPRSAAWRTMASDAPSAQAGRADRSLNEDGDEDDAAFEHFGAEGDDEEEGDVPPLYSEYLSRSRDQSLRESEMESTPPSGRVMSSKSRRSAVSSITRQPTESADGDGTEGGPNDEVEAGLGAEARARYQKARIKVLSKQVEQSAVIHKRLQEQVDHLQQSLREEREESKKWKKKAQQLESTSKRHSKKAADEGNVATGLQEDLLNTKRELATAERLAKQSDQQLKAKEAHLKRALETIDRLKSQVSQLEAQATHSNQGQQAQVAELQEKVRRLERQKGELINVLRKQTRLIDVLKRQKIHMEAARLLSFTEEEFMKTLDWTT